VLHTSDLHLSSLGDKACAGLAAVADLARQTKADLVIVAGDLFDDNRVDDGLVMFVAEQMRRVPATVAILPGNHDCLTRGSVFDKDSLWKDCDNVRVFMDPQGEILTLPSLGVSLWGKPIDSYEHDVRPLAGIPQPQRNGHWHIAVAHGYYVSTENPLFPSYNITRREIVTSAWDYIALGHLPTFRCVCDEPVKAYYCGAPSIGGTVAIIDMSENRGIQVACYSVKV
jgi:DNA repair exonuclease SbcCD nuclease subunit